MAHLAIREGRMLIDSLSNRTLLRVISPECRSFLS